MKDLDQHLLLYRSSGDPAALGALYDAAAPALLRIARRMTKDAAAAEDALQETFLTVAQKAEDWDPGRPAGPWLVGVLAHRAQVVRRQAARRVEPDRMTERSVPEPWESVQSEDFDQAVRKAVESLPPGEQAMVSASLFEGLGGVQLAERFGLRAGTARVQLHRALERLRGALPARTAFGFIGLGGSSARLAAIRAQVVESAGGTSVAVASKGGLVLIGLALAVAAAFVWQVALPFLQSDAGGSVEPVTLVALPASAKGVAGVPAAEERVALATASATVETVQAEEVAVAAGPDVPQGGTFEGRVVDSEGRPVADAEVEGWCGSPRMEAPDRIAVTDAYGKFRMEDLGPTFEIGAAKEGFALQSGFKGALDPGEAVEELDIVLTVAHRMRGQVVDSSGRPVAGVKVWTEPERGVMSDRLRTRFPDVTILNGTALETRTDESGRFEIGPVPTPRLRLYFEKAPFLVKYEDYEVPGSDVQVELTKGLALEGTVLDASGRPAQGTTVAFGPYFGNVHTGPEEFQTDDLGRFRVEGFGLPDTWGGSEDPYLTIQHDGHAVHVVQPIFPTAGATGPAIQVRLDPEQVIEGTVVDTDGEVLEGVDVWIEGSREMKLGASFERRPTWEFQAGLDDAKTDDRGAFRFPRLYAGTFELHLVDPDDRHRDVSFMVEAGSAPREYIFDPAAADKVVLAGTVVDSGSGEPVTDFTVCPMIGDSGNNRPLTSPDGQFRVSGLPAGLIQVYVKAEGYATTRLPERDFALGEHALEIELHPTRPFPFRVVDEAGESRGKSGLTVETLDGQRLSFDRGYGSSSGTMGVDESGSDVAFGLPSIPLRFTVRSDTDSAEFTVDLSLPIETEYEFVLPRKPPVPSVPVAFAFFALPNLTAAEVEAIFQKHIADDNRAGLMELVEGPEVLYPTVKVEVLLSRRGGEQSAKLTLEPNPNGGFLFSESAVQQSSTPWRVGYSSSTIEPTETPLPTVVSSLPAGTWDAEIKVGGKWLRSMVIEISPGESGDQEQPAIRIISI